MPSSSDGRPGANRAPDVGTPDFCAIDFGTSNSAIAVPTAHGMQLVPLEAGLSTMPTAVFYCTDLDDLPDAALRAAATPTAKPATAAAPSSQAADLPCCHGRAAVRAYMDGYEGRLLRSMKSILGSPLVDQTTEIGRGWGIRYSEVIVGYLQRLLRLAEAAHGRTPRRAVLGRPVFFVDDDPLRDAQAQAALAAAAHAAGLDEIAFQYEPIAAAFDYEQQCQGEERVLVADIGGGTSDFSVVRVGPARQRYLDRREDILANHGVHIAGTDFDRRVSLTAVMPTLGYGAFGPAVGGREPLPVPSRVYFDLATWHLINSAYQPARVAELKAMGDYYADATHHRRLMKVITDRLGHELAARAESAKITVATSGSHDIDLSLVEAGLHAPLSVEQTAAALADDLARIVACAVETVRRAGLQATQIDALYFTGGSTGLGMLTQQIEAAFPTARPVTGDRLASVATGLGLHAQRLFGPAGG